MVSALAKKEALNLISEHARDYLTLKITLPLGNPALKKVHTNSFCFFKIPDKFTLENWGVIGKALSSTATRFGGYEYGRWYIENVDISVDVKGKAEMTLTLNAFPTSMKTYTDDYASFSKAYQDGLKNNNTSGASTSATKTTTNATSKNSTLKGGQGKTIDNLVKKIIGGETNDLKKAKLIHGWLQKNVIYKLYSCTKYNTPEKCYNNRSHLNCADTARLTCSMMKSAGLNAWVVHRTSNNGHFWTLIKINGKIYASDQTGRESKSMSGSAWNTIWYASGDRRTCNSRGGNWNRNNGSAPDC